MGHQEPEVLRGALDLHTPTPTRERRSHAVSSGSKEPAIARSVPYGCSARPFLKLDMNHSHSRFTASVSLAG